MTDFKARKPYEVAKRVHIKIGFLDSPADFPDWNIYWICGVTMLRAVGHVLHKVDAARNHLARSIVDDFWKHPDSLRNQKIFKEFIDAERNSLLKVFETEVKILPVTTSSYQDRYDELSFDDLVAKYGVRSTLGWGDDGDDALRLYEIALTEWHRQLSIMEQAYSEGISHPFSKGGNNIDLLERSSFVRDLPRTPRL